MRFDLNSELTDFLKTEIDGLEAELTTLPTGFVKNRTVHLRTIYVTYRLEALKDVYNHLKDFYKEHLINLYGKE